MGKHGMFRLKESGYLLIATTIGIIVIGGLTAAFVTTIDSENNILGLNINNQKAWNIAKYGLNRAIKELSGDGNWSDTPATLYNAVSYHGGTYTVTVSNATEDTVFLSAEGRVGKSVERVTRQLTADGDPNIPGFLCIDASKMKIGGKKITKINLANLRLYDVITVDRIKVGIIEGSVDNIHKIKIKHDGWKKIWNGSAPQNTWIDAADFTIPTGEAYGFRVEFENHLNKKNNYLIAIELNDGSQYQIIAKEGEESPACIEHQDGKSGKKDHKDHGSDSGPDGKSDHKSDDKSKDKSK